MPSAATQPAERSECESQDVIDERTRRWVRGMLLLHGRRVPRDQANAERRAPSAERRG